MAKSTREYVFEGLEVLPEVLIPFVEKRLESALAGHWQAKTAERVHSLRPDSDDKQINLGVVQPGERPAVYINKLGDRGGFSSVQVVPGSSADVPDEADGVRAVVLGVAHPHNTRGESEALAAALLMSM